MAVYAGKLYVVSTPLGNIEDITLRAIRILQEADFCLVEDTRHTKKLFLKYGINTKMYSCYRHNENSRINYAIEQVKGGAKVALLSDAGTPGISDPGEKLIRMMIDSGLSVEVIPGACSPICALILSGMRMDRFTFLGFLPRKGSKRNKMLAKIGEETNTIILFESAFRLKRLVADLITICGDRKIAVCRELTKAFEEILRGKASDILSKIENGIVSLKGEIVVVFEGKNQSDKTNGSDDGDEDIYDEYE